MVSSLKITVVETCTVAPPPQSVPPTSLPLTFLDIPWLLFTPTQPLFFYEFPTITTTAHFKQNILPNLTKTLSLTLQHFFPFAGNLVTPSPHSTGAAPHLEYTEDDSILLTVAESPSAGDFKRLAANHQKTARDFRDLVPALLSAGSGGEAGSRQQLLAIQITVFPQAGISMGFTLRHVAADWRTFNNFLKGWSSLCKSGGESSSEYTSLHDRSVIRDPIGLGSTFLNEWWAMKIGRSISTCEKTIIIRSTFVLGPIEMESIKKWILTRSKTLFGSTQLLLSPYVLACAFLWVCWVKAHWSTGEENCVHYFGFVAGGMTRLHYTVPDNYAGNCVGFGRSSATRYELLGENGILFAARAIGDTIKKLNADMLGGAENWMSDWKVLRESELHIMVTGSPKVDLYGLDFGWGRPVKMEDVSIDGTGAISLCECREVVGGVEIGVALPKFKMDHFTIFFNKGLNHYSNGY
ncbi:hypothetical protein ABFX02_08G110500 [Erythranthe guttata]